MSAIAQPVAAQAARPERKPSGWDNLKPLMPYVSRYKGMVVLGLVLDALMGMVGALPQLIQGIIADCLSACRRRSQLSLALRALYFDLFFLSMLHLDRRVLAIYCLLIVGLMVLEGNFLVLDQMDFLSEFQREIEF